VPSIAPFETADTGRRAPLRFRRAIYRLHLWTGLVLSLYVVMLSITGSALVYRLELNRLFQTPAPDFDPDRAPLATNEIAEAARRAYPGYDLVDVGTHISRDRPVVEVRLAKGDDRLASTSAKRCRRSCVR
jgi:uncharacterized iron-regulated membrane protein